MLRFVCSSFSRSAIAAIAISCFVVGSLSTAYAAEPSDTALLRIPANAPLAVVIENPTTASSKWLQTAIGKLIAGESFAPFLSATSQQNLACPLYLRPWLGVDWTDLSKLTEPAVLFAIVDREQNAAICMVATTKTPAEAAQFAALGEAYFRSRNAKLSTAKVPDGELRIYEIPASGGEGPQVRVHAIQGNRFLATSSRSAADLILEHGKKATNPSILNSKQFVATRADALKQTDGGKADMFAYIDPVALAEIVDASPDYAAHLQKQAREAKRRQRKRDWLSVVKRQGLDAFKAIGVATSLRPGGDMDLEMHGAVIAAGPYRDSMLMFSFVPGAPVATPAWIDASALHYSSWYWNFTKAIEGLGAWGDEISGGPDAQGTSKDILESLKLDPDGPQLDVSKEVFANLGPRMAEMVDEKGVATKDNPRGKRFLQQIQIVPGKNSTLEKAFDRMFAQDIKLGFCKKSVVQGFPTWQALMPDKGLFDSTAVNEQEPGLSDDEDEQDAKAAANRKKAGAQVRVLTIGKDEVLVSSEMPLMTAALQQKPAAIPLIKDPRHALVAKRLAKWESPETCLRWFGQFQRVLEPGYEAVRQGRVTATSDLQARLWQLLILGTPESRAGQPVAKLPPYSAVEATMAPGGVQLTLSPMGFRFHAGSLTPAAK